MNLPATTAWFAGPKSENAEWFERTLARIAQDYYAWRRNYFPEDGLVLDSRDRHAGDGFRDAFEDRLFELLGRLKSDFPFHSPRYAAHMVAEQTLPSIAGYFAAMLYNPNNVSREAAPVTARLEHEASRLLCDMVGFGPSSWGHLTSGGTVANLEALWVARTVAYLPMAVEDMRTQLGVGGKAHGSALESFASVFIEAQKLGMPFRDALDAYLGSQWCIVERGLGKLVALDGKRPVIFAPETHHYCFDKAADVLGLGRENIVRVPVDSEFRMDVAKLAEFLDDPGIRPIAVVSVVGTTEEGAVDPVDQVAALRTHRRAEGKDGFWHHVDGAYGAYLRTMTRPQRLGLGDPWTTVRINGEDQQLPLVLPEQHTCDALEALSESDSVTIDPHKLGYVPYPAGAICFKSDLVKPLTRQEAPYIGDPAGSPEEERQSEGIGLYALEGSKPGAAAAAVWLSHSLIPLDSTGHGQLVRDTVRNACELHALLEQWPLWNPRRTVRAVPLTNPGSNIVCFAFRPVGSGSLASLNALNQAIYEAFSLNEGSERRVYEQEFFVSRTTLRPEQYSVATVKPFLARLGVVDQEYMTEGVRLLRCVLMNPWYEQAKAKGRWFLTEMVESLYTQAESLLTA